VTMTAEVFDRIPTVRKRWRVKPAILAATIGACALLFAFGLAEICEFVRWQLIAEEIWGRTAEPAAG
jgi:hypothetical protein